MKDRDIRFARTCGVAAVCLTVALVASCGGSRRSDGSASPPEDGAAAGSASGVPTAEELDAYVTGAAGVHLGMTETEVSAALGKEPTRRRDAMSPDAPTDVAWDDLGGAHPGAAVGSFIDDRLIRVEFAAANPVLPRLDRATAESVMTTDYVRRSVAGTLRMADIEAATRMPGHRASWIISGGGGAPTVVASRWMWEVDPGDEVLYVQENDGVAGQPVIRKGR